MLSYLCDELLQTAAVRNELDTREGLGDHVEAGAYTPCTGTINPKPSTLNPRHPKPWGWATTSMQGRTQRVLVLHTPSTTSPRVESLHDYWCWCSPRHLPRVKSSLVVELDDGIRPRRGPGR